MCSDSLELQVYPKLDAARGVPPSRFARILLVGTGQRAVYAARALKQSTLRSHIVGALDSNPQPELRREFPEIPVLGGFEDLLAIVADYPLDEIQVALPLRSYFDQIQWFQRLCKTVGVPVTLWLSLQADEEESGPGDAADPVVVTYHRHPSLRRMPRLVKRILDIAAASLAVAVLSPLGALIAVAIKLTSRGPVFFNQPRMGRGGRIFKMKKFRTMVENAEEVRKDIEHLNNARGVSFKLFRDPRVTAIGSFLRRSSMDELPQLLNVIRGEMSLVGPRPIPVWVAEQLRDPRYLRRYSVLPGITGYWQVNGRQQDFDFMAAQDLHYLDSWSLGLDLKILASTPLAVLGGKGAH